MGLVGGTSCNRREEDKRPNLMSNTHVSNIDNKINIREDA